MIQGTDPVATFDDVLDSFPSAVPIRQGGQKSVYAVDHPVYGPSVVKVGSYLYPGTLQRIRRECDLLREITSPYFPRLYDFVELPGSRFYSVEQRLDGDPLDQLLDKFRPPHEALSLLLELVRALLVLWTRQVVHRDVKPANIIIGANCRLWVIDLGIARLLEEASLTHTLAGRGPCTPVYAAPEQLQNRKREINHRSDQFACGIVTGQLLLGGQHPFAPDIVGSGHSVVDNIICDRWALDRFDVGYPSGVRALLCRMLGHQPYQRFRTPKELLQAVEGTLRG